MVAALALAGCGNNDPTATSAGTIEVMTGPELLPDESALPPVVDADRAEIAQLINEMRVAFPTGDEEAVCSGLAEDGAAMLFLAEQHDPPLEVDSCEEAVAAFIGLLPEDELPEFRGEGPYRPRDVDVSGGSQEVQVDCLEGDGNAWQAIHQPDGGWKLAGPFCSGR